MENLAEYSWKDIQKMAKDKGIRANQKKHLIIAQLVKHHNNNNNNNDDDYNHNNTDTGNKLNFPSGEEESELHNNNDDDDDDNHNNTDNGNLNGGFWEGQFDNGGFDNLDDDDGGGDNGQQAAPSSSSTASLRQKKKRANRIGRRGQKKMLCKRAPTAIQKKQQQQQHQQQTTEPQYELKAVHAYFKSDAGKEAYFVSWLDYRNKEWVLSVDMEGVELTNQFSREAGTHSTLKALCGKPVSTDQKNLIEADPYFQKLKNKFGAQLPAIESNKSDIWWAPNTQTELKRDAIKTLPEFIARCMSA